VKDEALLEKPVSLGAEASFTPISLISDCGRQACTYASRFYLQLEFWSAARVGQGSAYFLFWKTGTFSLRSDL
jgi:hypothetical protein